VSPAIPITPWRAKERYFRGISFHGIHAGRRGLTAILAILNKVTISQGLTNRCSVDYTKNVDRCSEAMCNWNARPLSCLDAGHLYAV